jgi:S1-C subfamily serine protease
VSARAVAIPLLAAVLGAGMTAGVLFGSGALRGSWSQARSDRTARDVYRSVAPGVVSVRARRVQGVATGSGFVLDKEGSIVTTAQLVASSVEVRVTVPGGRTVAAKVVGKDRATDLAVLRVQPAGLGLRPLELGDSGSLRVGDPAIAIGSTPGLGHTLTAGVVSAVRGVIRTDAALHPGNAGGPLLDATGRVIGVNSTGSGGSAFAVPVDTAKRVLPQLQEAGRVE